MATVSTRQKNRMSSQTFAFPKERKEPLNDARHVRNAVARFDQVEGVSDRERRGCLATDQGGRQEIRRRDQGSGLAPADEGRDVGPPVCSSLTCQSRRAASTS